MIDFHTHILPCIDDGSSCIKESLAMLLDSAAQDIRIMAATPHFYAARETPDNFLSRRTAAMQALTSDAGYVPELPRLLAGAEVLYYEGLARSDQLYKLRIEGTGLILIEMPYAVWNKRMLDDVCSIRNRTGLIPLVAHIERYLSANKRYVSCLCDSGALIQANADFFININTRRTAMKLLDDEMIHLIGSDCHNSITKRPNLGKAVMEIRRNLGEDVLARMRRTEQALFEDKPESDQL